MQAVTSRKYELAAELSPIHAGDVKAVLAIDDERIVSASRDQSVALWTRGSNHQFTLANVFDGHKAYVNSLTYIPAEAADGDDLLASGGNSSLILLHSLSHPQPEAVQCLLGHALNVCSLSYSRSSSKLLSGSWDCTARVWSKQSNGEWFTEVTLKGHDAAVWDVVTVDQGSQAGCYLTASADQLVILWSVQGDILLRIKGYPEPVRGLVVLQDHSAFASACNDGNIRITTFDGSVIHTLRGHTDSVFRVAPGRHDELLSCGEDHTADMGRYVTFEFASVDEEDQGAQVDTILHPCQTVWSVSSCPNGDIITGGSDGRVRVWTTAEERMASQETSEAFHSLMSKIPPKEHVLPEQQAQESREIVVDVDISDDKEPLKLTFRTEDAPHTVAEDFVKANDLPESYVDRIEEFILAHVRSVPVVNLEVNVRNP